jgi:dTDP-4-dehydrorhamnose reductase
MIHQKPRILVLGANGMLGSMLFNQFSSDSSFETFGTIRGVTGLEYFSVGQQQCIIPNTHTDGESGLLTAFAVAKPNVVINCIGIIKQLPNSKDSLESLMINAVLPHRLAKLCSSTGARLIHFSTDCVFSGSRGGYVEDDFPDANDLYGRSKYLGEVIDDSCITLRTSIIGHEINRSKSLVDWFLSQSKEVKGYKNAIFSGLPTIEVARVIKEYVLPNPQLSGLYHLSVNPINKFDLLNLVRIIYNKDIKITPDERLVIDRSLNSDKFRQKTGFSPRPWDELIEEMRKSRGLNV